MAVISLKSFTGLFPRVKPELLPQNAAQTAVDCDFAYGTLTGVVEDGVAIASTSAKSMYVPDSISSRWFAWNRDVDAVRGPIANDKYTRFYWTDNDGVWVSSRAVGSSGTEPGIRYRVGVPRPSTGLVDTRTDFKFPFIDYSQAPTLKAFCEDSEGNRSNEVDVISKITVDSSSVKGVTYKIDLSGVSCGDSSSKLSPGTGDASAQNGTADVEFYNIDALDSTSSALVYKRGSEYLFKTNKLSDSAHAVVVYYNGQCYTTTPGYGVDPVVNLYKIASGWYSTVAGATVPGTTLQTSTSQAAVEWGYTGMDGVAVKVVIRSSGADLPDEFSGLSVGVSVKDSVMTVSFTGDTNYVESRAYTYTYVNNYEEEGAPCEPLVVEAINGQEVTLSYTVPSAHDYVPFSKLRLYRTATGSQGTEYLFVGEYTINQSNPVLSDKVKTSDLGEPLSTMDFRPPETGLKGLIYVGNGMLAGFKENEVHVFEPYLPYASKSANVKTMPSAVVGLCAFESGFYVITTSNPVMLTGTSADAMADYILPAIQGGVSKGSICNTGQYVAYCSFDGIVALRGMDATLEFSQKFFTREVWKNLFANKYSKLRLSAHDGNLVLWLDDGSETYLIRFDEETPSMTVLTKSISSATVNPYADALYFVINNSLREFKAGSQRGKFVWKSKEFAAPVATNFAVAQVIGAGDVTIKIYADGVLKHTKSMTIDLSDQNVFKLPSGFKSRLWSVEITGEAGSEVKEFHMANSVAELKNV